MSESSIPPAPSAVPDEAIQALDAALTATADRINRYIVPMFELEDKRVQTLSTLSAGAIVASLTIFQTLGTGELQGKIWLALTWGAFIVSIVFCLATVHDLTVLRSMSYVLLSKQNLAFQNLVPHSSPAAMHQAVMAQVMEITSKTNTEMEKHVKDYGFNLGVAGTSFLVGLCLFVVFGLVNLF